MNSVIPVELSSRMKALGLYPHDPGRVVGQETNNTPPRPSRKKSPRRGRPSIFSEEVADALYELILTQGLKDARAAGRVGISAFTISRWKRKIPHFAEFFADAAVGGMVGAGRTGGARAKFDFSEIKQMVDAKPRDARSEVARAKWLLQKSNPQKWGRPGHKPVL